ncbi:MAG TPA: WhiB family transcriptional regulator, partial [Mycobacterium sp.]|nr:WhiB family transcriptional regulator [Mycobacterium sp.]
MAFEQADFGESARFDNRLLGSVGSAPHIQTGPVPGTNLRPQLSVVPDRFDDFTEDSDLTEDQWQERALCAQTDPEAFFPEKGGSTREPMQMRLASR